MSFTDTVESISNTVEDQARIDNNRMLLAELRYNSLQNVLVSGLFAIFFSQFSDSPSLWIWWVAIAVVVAARVAVLRWLEAADGFDETQRALTIYACIGVTALAWGFAPLACGSGEGEMFFILAVSWVAIIVIGGASAFPADPLATVALA